MTTKPFFSVFPDLKVSDDVRSLFEDANIKEITLKKRDNMLKISFQCDHLISRVDTWRMERTIREQLFSKRFVKIRFQESYHLSEQYNLKYLMEHYMKSFLFELKGKGEVIFNVVRKGDYKVSDNVITFYFEDTFVNRNKAPEIKDFFETILKNRFSIDAKVGFDFSKTIDQSLKMESNYRLQQEIHTIVEHADTVEKEQKEEKKARKKAAVTKKEHTFKKKPKYSDDPTLLYGRNCDGELMEIKDIYDEIGEVVVHGQITFLETREIRNEKTIIIFHITDFTDTISCKIFVRNEQLPDILDGLKKGKFYSIKAVAMYDKFDHAIALAKKNHYSLHIVTLEGEYLSPGGSMTGGAFKNSSNLLARRREVEELETKTNRLLQEIAQIKNRREDLLTAIELNEEDLEQVKETLQKEFIRQNTAKINVDRAMQQKNESEEVFSSLMKERQQMDRQVEEIRADQTGIKEELEHSRQQETEIQHANEAFQKMLEEQKELENKAESELSRIQLEEANIRQKVEFAQTNVERINGDLEKFETEKTGLLENAKNSKEDVEKKQHDIAEIQKTILASSDSHGELEQKLRESVEQKEQMSAEYRGFFRKQEEISERCNGLDKEVFRLNNQREKLNESAEQQTNYLWEEYELTPHAAAELRNSEYEDPLALKKLIAAVKDEIRKLGTVNVNAIEEYKEVSERYTFLKGQHDDLVEAEQTLLGIIEDLDSGMRKQFMEKFAEIQKEFNASFKHLFGGGHGALELVEDEDILECGIRIIAQPPGKKLQNMMQMSGGEKSLTAISLLFAIQNLKPSPFCLLDEIEAALDDSNVSRFAKYLHKLTKSTQFIVITHRRGTMAAADRLYGITMQEKGVSTLVSVNLIDDDLSN